jgi:hypothetical protein
MDHFLLQTVRVLTLRRFNVALCNSMSSETKPERKAVRTHCGLPQSPVVTPTVADRIAAFLDGRTHGEDLLHELYDYVLEEPIPRSMRALLK